MGKKSNQIELNGSTYINKGLRTDLMCVNDARLTSSRSTDSARTGGDDADDSSVDVIGVDDCNLCANKLSAIEMSTGF